MFNMEPAQKRFKLFYIYEILLRADKPLKRLDICDALADEYDIELSEKSMTEILTAMREAGLIVGVPHERAKRKKKDQANKENRDEKSVFYTNYTINHRPISDKALEWLIDTVRFSKHISEDEANALMTQLLRFGPQKLQRSVERDVKQRRGFNSKENVFFDNVHTLKSAIEDGKCVCFKMLAYTGGKKPTLRLVSDEPLHIKPLETVTVNGDYYLIAFDPISNSLQHYRVDRMRNVECSEEEIFYDAFRNNISIDEYRWTHSLMRSGKAEIAVVRVPNEKMDLVLDRFGAACFSFDSDGNSDSKVQIRTNAIDLYMWALENSEFVEVLEPQYVRNKLRTISRAMHAKYSREDTDKYYEALERASREFMHQYQFACPDFNLNSHSEWKELENLTELYIENNRISDLSFVSGMPGLRKVQIINERVADLRPLIQLKQLGALTLCDTLVNDISFLSDMSLRWLKLTGNYNIEDYSVLYKMNTLRHLWVDEDTLSEIDVKKLKENNTRLEIRCEQESGEVIKL